MSNKTAMTSPVGQEGYSEATVSSASGKHAMSGPLAGIRIIEMAGLGPCPFAAMLLSDMGAEVIRVHAKGSKPVIPLLNTRYDVLARGRRSMAIDLKKPSARKVMLGLIDKADAIIEGFRPGVMERLGLGPEICHERNPRLVFGRMTGWGQTGPLALRAGHDINYVALSGLLNAIGRKDTPPVVPLNVVGDFGGGTQFAFGVVCAILSARTTGCGQIVDTAMTDSAALLAAMIFGFKAAGAWSSERYDNLLDGAAHFYDTYECADGKFVAVGAIEAQFYAELLSLLGIDGEAFAKQNDKEQWPLLKQRLADTFRTKPRDEWAALFENSDACLTPVLDWDEAILHPHNRDRGSFIEIAGVVQPGPAVRFSGTPTQVARPPSAAAEHTEEILRDWDTSPDAIAALRRDEAI